MTTMTNERALVPHSNTSLKDVLLQKIMEEQSKRPTEAQRFAHDQEQTSQLLTDFFGGDFLNLEDAKQHALTFATEALEQTKELKIKKMEVLQEKKLEDILERQESQKGENFQRLTIKQPHQTTFTPTTESGVPGQTRPATIPNSNSTYKPPFGSSPSSSSSSSTGAPTPPWAAAKPNGATPSQPANNVSDSTPNAMNYFDNMTGDMRRLGMQGAPFWKAPAPKEAADDYVHYMNWKQKLKHKARKFFKSGKGKTTVKMAALIGVQFAMAIVGKRYQFENAGQMATMFTLMLASFFITRELKEDGIDTSVMNF